MALDEFQLAAAGLFSIISLLAAYYYVFSGSQGRPVLIKDQFQEFPLIQKTVLSHNSGFYRFGLPKPTDTLGLPIGQHISIAATINEKEVVRSYTPTSSDFEKGYFDLVIKSYPNGNISKFISELNIGETIKVRGPKGFFNYVPNEVKHYGMVAGGTGITPMYQIIQEIVRDPKVTTKCTLIYGNVNEEDILLKKELDDIVENHSNIKVYYVLDHPPKVWNGGSGYITQDILKEHLPSADPENRLLICGPPAMSSSIKKSGVALGFAKAKPVSKSGDQTFLF